MTTKMVRKRPALLDRVVQTIRERRLFAPGQHLLVAVSGGPDSVALVSLLAVLAPSWRLKLSVVHFNFGLRGAESDGDEAFVSSYCRARLIPLTVRRPILSKSRRVSSLQMLAREARYEALKSLAQDIQADRIVTGHTANDQAETMILWMLRGAGLTGLAGMPFIREKIIVRPLLNTTREEILDYLRHEGLAYRQDSTNLTGLFRRNRVRRDLLPVMEEITPSIVRLLQRQADVLRADDDYLQEVVNEWYQSLISVDARGRHRFGRKAVAALPEALKRRLVRETLKSTGSTGQAPSLRVVERVLQFVSGRSRATRLSLRGVDVIKEGEHVLIMPRIGAHRTPERSRTSVPQPVVVSVPSRVYWPGSGQEIHVQEMPRHEAEPLLTHPTRNCAVFDAALVSAPFVLRPWQAGDRIYPRGMGGKSKKLQDLFTDSKVSREERLRIPLLTAREGILWVVGRREDERFIVRERTSRCLVATVQSHAASEGAE